MIPRSLKTVPRKEPKTNVIPKDVRWMMSAVKNLEEEDEKGKGWIYKGAD
jgi:hypothetical protein